MSNLTTDVVHTGDAFDVLDELPASSVHAVVTDPPYGLAFMGRDWDDFEPKEYQEWCEEWARKAKRVLKPGGHLLAFSGNRTHHRLFSGVEDAGLTVRDTLTWHYGSGFPKALDVSKAVDKRQRSRFVEQLSVDILQEAGVPDAEKTFSDWTEDGHVPSDEHWQTLKDGIEGSQKLQREVVDRVEFPDNTPRFTNVYGDGEGTRSHDVTAPATDAAERWDGWKTCMKPATEFVVMARKPLEGTVAENVQKHGTGALNIGGACIETEGRPKREITRDENADSLNYGKNTHQQTSGMATGETDQGRYPSNVVFDETAARDLDQEVGELDAGAHTPQGAEGAAVNCYGDKRYRDAPEERYETDSGGPSRYFYTSKATKAERTLDGKIENAHPTVKPQDLMEWLVRLVAAEGQVVLDPFAGSGTTLMAAKQLGRKFVGVERQEQWADVARVRCGLSPNDPSHVRDKDDAQTGLEAFADGGFNERS